MYFPAILSDLLGMNAPGDSIAPGPQALRAAAPPAPSALATVCRVGRLTRGQRVLLLLCAIWLLSAFDLAFTLNEAQYAHFIELNPIAAVLLAGPVEGVVAYKFGMLGIGTVILLAVRRYSVAELGAWFLLAACVYVVARWHAYYELLVSG